MVKTSIILTAYDRIEDTLRCLTSLSNLKDEETEILLMHDHHHASEQLQEACSAMGIKYIHSGQQKGGKEIWRVPGFALNIGVRQSSGSNLIIGNSEILVSHPLQDQIQVIEEGYLCSPKILAENVGVEHYYRSFLPFFLGLPRKVFESIGGYDEDFTGTWYDDDDFILRAGTKAQFVELPHVAVHLEHNRANGQMHVHESAAEYNRKLFEQRKGIVVRNQHISWGQLDKEYN